MKKLIGKTAAVALAFAGCQKPVAQQPDEPERPPASGAPIVASTPQPVVAPAPVAVAPPASAMPAPQMAPPGVFYLLTAARVETSEGIRGLPPGTGVKLVRPGIYLTPAGEAALRDDQVTNNMALAREARDADRAGQAAMKQRLAGEAERATASSAQAAVENDANHKSALKQIERQRVEAQLSALKLREAALKSDMTELRRKRSKENYNRVVKDRIVTSTTDQTIKESESQLAIMHEQIRQLEAQLNSGH